MNTNTSNLITQNRLSIKVKIQQIGEIINHFKKNHFTARIEKECKMLLKQNPNSDLTIKNDTSNTSIHIEDKDKDKSYTIILNNECFPFKAPLVLLNNKPYEEFLRLNNDYERSLLKKIHGIDCLLCNSLICPKNWTPVALLISIIDEIDKIYIIKKSILNKLLADKIKAKYLLEDIDVFA
jgi:hypothetical protein